MSDLSQYEGECQYATYTPEDDKLRIYSGRVSRELYDELKKLGFGRAPKQGCFFQVWSPPREDAALALCGEITDEDSSLFDRADERSVRFATYSNHAEERAGAAYERAQEISERFAGGQPILVGHHSERSARRDQERADSAASKAVEEFKRRDYWSRRAKAVQRHATYLVQPPVIARRIKTLEADLRRSQKDLDTAESRIRVWTKVDDHRTAVIVANRDNIYHVFPVAEYPGRNPDEFRYDGPTSLWNALTEEICTWEQARRIALTAHAWTARNAGRWVEHLTGEIEYWKAVLQEKTGKDPDEQMPLTKGAWVHSRDGWFQVERVNRGAGKKINSVTVKNNPREPWNRKVSYERIKEWLSDEEYRAKQQQLESQAERIDKPWTPPAPDPAREAAEKLVEQVREADIQVNYDPDYFPTPPEVVERLIELADLHPVAFQVNRMLEPSAGDGRICQAAKGKGFAIHCCELNTSARAVLEAQGFKLVGADFMEFEPTAGVYQRIIMNPPFSRKQWVAHIKHAWDLLNARGGILVSVVPYGYQDPDEWAQSYFGGWVAGKKWRIEELPPGAFKDSGTGINTAILVMSWR